MPFQASIGHEGARCNCGTMTFSTEVHGDPAEISGSHTAPKFENREPNIAHALSL